MQTQKRSLATLLGLSLSASLSATPLTEASRLPAGTQVFVSGNFLPKPAQLSSLLDRIEANPVFDWLFSEIHQSVGSVPFGLRSSVLPLFDGEMTVAWVRTQQRSSLDLWQNRPLQEDSHQYLSRQVNFIGKEVQLFQKRYKRLPTSFQEMVDRKVRKTLPTSQQADFVLDTVSKPWQVTATYKGELELDQYAPAPRYVGGRGLLPTQAKAYPPTNLVFAVKITDEAKAKELLSKLSSLEPKFKSLDQTHWTLENSELATWTLQVQAGWLAVSDNPELLTAYATAAATPSATSLAGNPRFQLQQKMLSGNLNSSLFAFADIQDIVQSTRLLGELPPAGKMLRSVGLVSSFKPSQVAWLPESADSELFLEVDNAGKGLLPKDNTPAPTLGFLARTSAKSPDLYALHVSESLRLLRLLKESDPTTAEALSGAWSAMDSEPNSRAEIQELARSIGWISAETEMMDQFVGGMRMALTSVKRDDHSSAEKKKSEILKFLEQFPSSLTVELLDPAANDKLAQSVWNKLGDGSPAKKVGPYQYWPTAGGTWIMSQTNSVLTAGSKASRRLVIRTLDTIAGDQPSKIDNTSVLAVQRKVQGRPIFVTYANLEAAYSIIKGFLLLFDSEFRPEAEVFGQYRDNFSVVTVQEQGFHAYSTMQSASTSPLKTPVAVNKEIMALKEEVAKEFHSEPVPTEAGFSPFLKARAQGQLTACKSNQKNIGTACEMYSTDHAGRYPASLKQLTPDYLRVIPKCPSAGADTYSSHYRKGSKPDRFTVRCWGEHHKLVDIPANYPMYDSEAGLTER